MSVSLTACAHAAEHAARAAGALLLRHVDRPKRVSTKRNAVDLVTNIDRASERLISTTLQRATPAFDFLGEERGAREAGAAYRWIVDPIDGTNNFVHGLPLFGVSIGLEHRGRVVVGVVYDPSRRELFSAIRGRGARLNGRRVRVARTRRLAESLVSTGFSFNFRRHAQPYQRWFRQFQCRSHGVRRIGSTVLCLAWIAAGRLEGFYERDLWPWDIAAGSLLVAEAGGRVTDLDGGPASLSSGQLLASNGRIHREMLRILKNVNG
ncbi:MAG: inositol monophosphatase [Candidatus Omnitrophica bacterium]|nr:inositol monophosphatase [Candidatus Omnitrophota bacterium]